MLPDLSPLLGQRDFLTIAHHVPGRIRIKLAVSGLARLPKVDPAPFLELVKHIRGVKMTRINVAALSVVIDYDTNEIPVATWDRLLVGDLEEIERLLTERMTS